MSSMRFSVKNGSEYKSIDISEASTTFNYVRRSLGLHTAIPFIKTKHSINIDNKS